ncbi:hypothetical protein DQ384_08855 [Sphaerisporangium album]|uniref:Uncharacterized protein n=1 Tax=Sphaerisporangium album TaxID=509200 RepID=A0A367FPW2_9ACTN|nr:hypothetical protein [Sphaerisporangium album]RCG31655.1 hypothetical protein DQ384_08855 [Sphaerisporangium album]
MRSPKITLALAALAACASLAACGSSSDQASAPTAAATDTAANGASQAGKVSANKASESEIAAALKGAGVSNPDRWAREVVEYRPYDAGDTNLNALRQNLAKYNPGEDTVNKIVSALTP